VYGGSYPVFERGREFVETMAPRAAASVTQGDTRLLVSHQEQMLPLARSSRTMQLDDDSRGLHFRATLDTRQSHAKDAVLAIERGDLSGVSVGMVVGRDEWNPDRSKRTVTKLSELPEISLVNFPANPDAQVKLAQRWAKRAGAVLSASNAAHILEAHRRLGVVLNAAGIQLPQDDGDGLTAQPVSGADSSVSGDSARGLVSAADVRRAQRREQMARRLEWLQTWEGHPAVEREIQELTLALRRAS